MTKFADIVEAYKDLKKEKEEIDLKPIVKNTVKSESADSLRSRQAMLPDEETHFRIAESISPMFDTTKRAGAGGTKSGLPGIRPHGGKAASKFLDDFTGTGRMPKKKDAFEEPVKIKDGRKLDIKPPSVVIYKKCMDCMGPVNPDACVPSVVPLPPGELIAPQEKARWESVGIMPGDILCYLFCIECAKGAHRRAQELNATGLDMIVCGRVVKAGQRYLKERGAKISEHVFQHVKSERGNPETDIFYGDAKNR